MTRLSPEQQHELLHAKPTDEEAEIAAEVVEISQAFGFGGAALAAGAILALKLAKARGDQ